MGIVIFINEKFAYKGYVAVFPFDVIENANKFVIVVYILSELL